ncbi:MAG: hypothetical protein MZV70_59390 [Desulfobacterales bacterium]|nr:hypothetical protein [Desulfobacterales bacterium]
MTPTEGVSLARVVTEKKGSIFEGYRVNLPAGRRTFVLRYGGKIYHDIRPVGREHARGFGTTAGMIGSEGVYLSGSSFGIPGLNATSSHFPSPWRCPWDGSP